MGLISDGSQLQILTDIPRLEDHFRDMDFKVAGTREGITALQNGYQDWKELLLKSLQRKQLVFKASKSTFEILGFDRTYNSSSSSRTRSKPLQKLIQSRLMLVKLRLSSVKGGEND